MEKRFIIIKGTYAVWQWVRNHLKVLRILLKLENIINIIIVKGFIQYFHGLWSLKGRAFQTEYSDFIVKLVKVILKK